mmetsp:Transcript_1939/g.6780  ORF Transcript_1939/g.6780 Transcript_1939/m.6780 type:complete len:239 (+) Transcript_1939:151-867(+)
MNNNSSAERALLAGCNGVFSTTSYVTLGTKDAPLSYGQKEMDRSCYNGKQIMTNPPKMGKTVDVYFQKEHPWISDKSNFEDRLMYSQLQKEKKKGFLSGDFKRRDEYTAVFRVNQYREQLAQEASWNKKALQVRAGEREAAPEAVLKDEAEAAKEPVFLYDLVFEKDVPDANGSKQARDTKNPALLSKERDFGTYKTMSQLVGYGIDEAEHAKPEFARTPIVQSTFYRRTNIPLSNKQ